MPKPNEKAIFDFVVDVAAKLANDPKIKICGYCGSNVFFRTGDKLYCEICKKKVKSNDYDG